MDRLAPSVSPNFGKIVLRNFIGEVGDKTFFVSLLFIAWIGTWTNVRNGSHRRLHQLFVFLGACCALMTRAILVYAGVRPAWWNSGFDFTSAAILFMLGMRVRYELRCLRPTEHVKLNQSQFIEGAGHFESWNPLANKHRGHVEWDALAEKSSQERQGAWNPLSYSINPKPMEEDTDATDVVEPTGAVTEESQLNPSSYGSVPPVVKEVTHSVADVAMSIVFVFLTSLILVFVCEAGDRSAQSLFALEHDSLLAVAGAMAGWIPALLIAACVAFIMEGTLMDDLLLFAVELGFFALSLTSISSGCLSLGALAVSSPMPSGNAFLALRSMVYNPH